MILLHPVDLSPPARHLSSELLFDVIRITQFRTVWEGAAGSGVHRGAVDGLMQGMSQEDVAGEMFDVVDEHDRVVGRASRAEAHRRGLKHRAAHVLVFNGRGELFVQQRGAGKDTFPLCWDSSAAGHLESGEEYAACAARELREELGLEPAPGGLTPLFKIEACAETGWEFVWVYRAQWDGPVRINPAEIAGGRFMSCAEVQRLAAEQPAGCAPSFLRVCRELAGRGLWPSPRATGSAD
jgi:isopentenyl-diphosphate delta-isomerase type 1